MIRKSLDKMFNLRLPKGSCTFFICTFFILPQLVNAQAKDNSEKKISDSSFQISTDTVKEDLSNIDTMARGRGLVDSLISRNAYRMVDNIQGMRDKVDINVIDRQPYISVQQYVKGNAAGIYSVEESGEPGTEQLMYIRGLTQPILNHGNVSDAQPTVYVNGIPLIRDNSFVYNIQGYDINPIGPATNLLASIDQSNIESIEILKDASTLAKLGPNAANGAVWITLKTPQSGRRKIEINSYYGFVQAPTNIYTINAAYQNAFEQPFYQKYATTDQKLAYPIYLSDSTDLNYYGPSNWTDLYFKNSPVHSLNMSLSGGSKRANFRFNLNNTSNDGVGDGTGIDKYGASFAINMVPVKWLNVYGLIDANRLQRKRNQNLRDRFAEVRYFPDLTTPLPPNKNVYSQYLSAFANVGNDDNKSNAIRGQFGLSANFKNLTLVSQMGFDYNEGIRDLFIPSAFINNNNFTSNYFGYDQRFFVNSSATYDFKFGVAQKQKISITAGQQYQSDKWHYDYIFGYNTPNDFIKIPLGDISTGGQNNYLPKGNVESYAGYGATVYPYSDNQINRLASYYGEAKYNLNDYFSLAFTLRHDGSSAVQPNLRWITTPSISANWDIKRNLMADNNIFSSLNLRASYGKIGRYYSSDRYQGGPQYVVDGSFNGDPSVGTYLEKPITSRPYTLGYTGYNIGWQYSNKTDVGLDVGFFDNRLTASIDVYNNDETNSLLAVPAIAESGYMASFENGMKVNNKGLDLTLNALIIKRKVENGFNWSFNGNLSYNKNTLKALPGGVQQIVSGNNLLKVGSPIDAFWVLQNEGIYTSSSQVPTVNGKPLSIAGESFTTGDAIWKDQNNDGIIDDNDRVLKGHYLPSVYGGFGSDFNYKKFNLNFQFTCALGQSLLNADASNKLNFINNESGNDINSIKEIFYWQKTFNPNDYPQYNPFSNAVNYRLYQDLFLQNASYVKLRSLTFGYDLGGANHGIFKTAFTKALIYVSGTNLLSFTKDKYVNPELVDFTGTYTGYGMAMPKTFIVGIRLEL
ncbi:SusC/RagA family TonB-linked outer membrane protein [Arachidicoccus soli]|nr:SusC/RagA family TonB-linked outer membrane protein [Arachidicoccus soli]